MKAVVVRLQTRRWHKPGRIQLTGVSESVHGKEFRHQKIGWGYDSAVSWLVRNGYRFLRCDGGRRSGDYAVGVFGLVSEFGLPRGSHLPQDEIERIALDYEDEFVNIQGGVS